MSFSSLNIILRKMRRNRMSSVVNILGLSLGISCTFMIAVLLRFELSFNTMYPKGDRIYRVVTQEGRQGGGTGYTSGSPGAISEAMLKEFPDVEQATMVFVNQAGQFTVQNAGVEKKFKQDEGVVYALPEFFRMFDIRMIEGAPKLDEPNTVVLTQQVARRLFGSESPLGKTVRLNGRTDLTIVGVAADPPENSDLAYTVYISGAGLKKNQTWIFDWRNLSSNIQTFVLLREHASVSHVESMFPRFKNEYMRAVTYKREFSLQPLSAMHYEPEYADLQPFVVSSTTLAALGIIGLFLILTACVNFVNMATAQASNRAREVGVRKVLGAFKKQIAMQFLGETLFTIVVSCLLSLVIAELVFPVVTRALNLPINLQLLDPMLIGFLLFLVIVMTLLSGLYPALILSGFVPASALKGQATTGGRILRRGLVVFQFAISQMLMAGTLVVILQMQHVKTLDLGLNPEGVLTVPIPGDTNQLGTLKNRLKEDPNIRSVSFSWTSAISNNDWDSNIRYQQNGETRLLTTDLKFADPEYLATYGLTLLAGRNYAKADTIKEFVVNEAFIHAMGIQRPADALGKMIQLGRTRAPMPIVGVVRDFNARSLHEAIRPCLLATRVSAYSEIGMKVRAADLHATLVHIEKVWTAIFPEHIFEYQFLDERIKRFYEQEERVQFLFGLFAPIAILIGCIGLIGLVSFVTTRKTKEIGVRKVLGASVTNILMMLSKEFVQLIVLAFAVAVPVSYYVMNGWLENFAYRIAIGPLVFLAVFLATALIAALTVGYRSIRAATANPVESLRYE